MNTTQEKIQTNTASENEAENKERYWSQLLTGDIYALPTEVRSRIEAGRGFGGNDAERLSRAVMQSWVADMGDIPGEKIRKNWAQIRQNVGKQYGVNSDSDHELYVAVSMQNQVKKSQQRQLLDLYHNTYTKHLSNQQQGDEAEMEFLDDEIKDLAVQVCDKARLEAQDDKNRLHKQAATLRRAMEWFDAVENPQHDGPGPVTAFHVNRRAVGQMDDVFRAAQILNEVSDDDKHKLWCMISPKQGDEESLRQVFSKSVRRGVMTAGSGMGQALAHGAVSLLPDGEMGGKIDRYARSIKEIQDFANHEFAPLITEKNDTWLRRFIADVGQQGANAALAFCGPVGLGALALEEMGHTIAHERQQNPNGTHSVQMNTALATGLTNAALAVGLNRLGQKLLGDEIKAFRSTHALGRSNLRDVAKNTLATLGRETAEELVENKSTEISSMLIKDAAHALSGEGESADWQAWGETQLNVNRQLYEAAVMMPLILIGAGKSSLTHFRQPQRILRQGAPLRIMGVAEDSIRAILAENDPHQANALLKEALQASPMWGSLYISRKAMEWSRILGENGQPLLRTEQEVCDFLDMPPTLRTNAWKAKQFPEAEAKLAELHGDADFMAARVGWLMRAGLPHIEEHINQDGKTTYTAIPPAESDYPIVNNAQHIESALNQWNRDQKMQESRDLALLSGQDDILAEKLVQGNLFEKNADALQKAYLEERLQQLAWRPARLLLLAYPEEFAGQLKKSPQDWEALTAQVDAEMRANVVEGVLELLNGTSFETVQHHLAERFWSQFCRDEHGQSRAKKLLATVQHLSLSPQSGDMNAQALVDELVRISHLFRGLRSRQREDSHTEWVELNRLLWASQADVMVLHHLLPNMKEFDAGVARGYLAPEIFGSLLAKHLDIPAEKIRPHFRHLSPDKLRLMTQERTAKDYGDTDTMIKNLELLESETIQQIDHQGQPLWRVHYPDGQWSVWHKTRAGAVADLASHVYMVMTPYQYPKWMMVKWWNKKLLADDMDATHLRMQQEDLFGSDEKRLPGPYECLSRIATHDLIRLGYGGRGMLGPGEEFSILDKGRSTEDIQTLAPDARRERQGLAEQYEALPSDAPMGVDAYNEPILSADGTVRSRMVLNNTASPLAVLEDKAEVVWDRLMRTGQLPLKQAVRYLQTLGRLPKSARKLNPMRVTEELSQLSKEFYLAHRNHPLVPESMRIWLRYSCALPARANENLVNSVHRSQQTLRDLEKLDDSFLEMLKESVGMSELVRTERHWLPQVEVGLPMMERFYHRLRAGDLLDNLPTHVAADLVKKLGNTESRTGADEALARQCLHELAEQLKKHPQLVYWRPDSSQPGKFQCLLPKYQGGLINNKALPRLKGHKLHRELQKTMPSVPTVPAELSNEYRLRTNLNLPKAWKNNPELTRALETLEVIRNDFASRPMATEQGIVWQGKLYHYNSNTRPAGVGSDWAVRVPMQELLPKHKQMEELVLSGQAYPRIADLGMQVDETLLKSMACNVVYLDPQDETHTIRLMSGAPDSLVPELQQPYVVHVWNGVYLDATGEVAASEKARCIPLEQFTGAAVMPHPEQMQEARQKERLRLLQIMTDSSSQKKRWLSRKFGSSSFFEDTVRLSEELGLGEILATDSLSPADDLVMATMNLLGYGLKHPNLLNWEWQISADARTLLKGRVKELIEILQAYEYK